jgi:Fibronectin type III domain
MKTIQALLPALAAVGLAGAAFAAEPAGPAASTPTRQLRLGVVDLSARLPADLLSPEGKSRWNLGAVPLTRTFVRSFSETAEGVVLEDRAGGADLSKAFDREVLYRDDLYQDDRDAQHAAGARRWLFPDRFPDLLRPGSRTVLEFSERRGGRDERVRAEVAVVGIGWLDLPSGPREVVLQRALLSRDAGDGRGPVAGTLLHRFVDPRAGVVAEIARPAAAGGGPITEAVVVEQVLAGAATLKIYVDQLDTPAFTGISYGWDRGAGTTIASMTPQGYNTMGDLIAADTWDFSGNTSGGAEDVSTGVPVTAAETCNASQCGYNPGGLFPNRILSREDLTPNGGTLSKTNAVTEREARAADVTVWLRGGAQFEGSNAAAPNGESRFCYVNDDGVARTPVPIWRFPNQDPIGWFMQPGDPAWVGGPFNCEQNIFNAVCGVGGIVPKLWTKGCTGSVGTHTGTQSGQVLKGGVVALPSGHTFNALLVKTVADFCVYVGSSCASFLKADEVRTFVYLWQVPVIGTVARLTSVQNAADGTSFTSVAGTDFIFGLFPPLSMTVSGTTDTTASITWDPGRDTHRISGYKVYWGTTSGSGGPYAFDSTRNPGQVAIAGTTATISGLSPGTTYYVTVTSLSAYQDPSSGVTTTYESLLYPTQVSGDPAFVYPIEVQATTTGGTCIPAVEVTNLTLQTATGGAITFCWDPVSDPCLQGYEILQAPSPTAAGNFSVLADTGTGTCFTGNAPFGYFLVVARGTGGTGPWGAYGR